MASRGRCVGAVLVKGVLAVAIDDEVVLPMGRLLFLRRAWSVGSGGCTTSLVGAVFCWFQYSKSTVISLNLDLQAHVLAPTI